MIIEFIGIPGSGKTYLSQKMYSQLKLSDKVKKIYTYSDLVERIKKRNKFFLLKKVIPLLFNFSFLLFVIKIFRSNSPLSTRIRMVKRYFIRILVYKESIDIKKIERESVFIFDEGFMHFYIEYFRQSKNYPREIDYNYFISSLQKNINYSSLAKFLVFVDSDVEENFNRIENRKEGWPGKVGLLRKKERMDFLKQNNYAYLILRNNKKNIVNSLVIDNKTYLNNYIFYFNDIIEKISNHFSAKY